MGAFFFARMGAVECPGTPRLQAVAKYGTALQASLWRYDTTPNAEAPGVSPFGVGFWGGWCWVAGPGVVCALRSLSLTES